MDAAEIARLLEINEAATPGPWKPGRTGEIYSEAGRIVLSAYAPRPECGRAGDYYECNVRTTSAVVKSKPEDAAYISAFDPPTTRALLDALEQAQKEHTRDDWADLNRQLYERTCERDAAQKERNNFRAQLGVELNKESRRKGILTKANNDRCIAEIERDAAQKDARALLGEYDKHVSTLVLSEKGRLVPRRDTVEHWAVVLRPLRARIEAMLAQHRTQPD